jgi:hypothetical protein
MVILNTLANTTYTINIIWTYSGDVVLGGYYKAPTWNLTHANYNNYLSNGNLPYYDIHLNPLLPFGTDDTLTINFSFTTDGTGDPHFIMQHDAVFPATGGFGESTPCVDFIVMEWPSGI